MINRNEKKMVWVCLKCEAEINSKEVSKKSKIECPRCGGTSFRYVDKTREVIVK